MAVKKLAIVLCVVAAGVSVALVFRKDATSLAAWNSSVNSTSLDQPVERRVGAAPWSVDDTQPVMREPVRVPTAATSGEQPQAPGTVEQPTFRQSVHPVAALLEPIDGIAEDDAERVREEEPADDPDPENPGALHSDLAETHVVVDGDTLTRLAVRYLGRADGYQQFFDLNRDVLSSPDLLPIGARLKIPPRGATGHAPRQLNPQANFNGSPDDQADHEPRMVPLGPPPETL
jgi:hypothetical protein